MLMLRALQLRSPDLQRPPGTPWLSPQAQRVPPRTHCEALVAGRSWPLAEQQAAPRQRGPCQASLAEMRRLTLQIVSRLALCPLKLRSVKRTQAENKEGFKERVFKRRTNSDDEKRRAHNDRLDSVAGLIIKIAEQ